MANRENLLRIKINGLSLIKLSSQYPKRDFVLTFPPIKQNNCKIECHFTLHTPNDRITFKTTSVKIDNVEKLPLLINRIKDHPLYVDKVTPNDLDLYRGKPIINLNNPKKISYAGTIALNMINSKLENYFDSAKTSDAKFKHIKNIVIPSDKKRKVTIKFGFGKNFTGDITPLINKGDDYFIFKERNYADDEYTFFFLVLYSFPETPH